MYGTFKGKKFVSYRNQMFFITFFRASAASTQPTESSQRVLDLLSVTLKSKWKMLDNNKLSSETQIMINQSSSMSAWGSEGLGMGGVSTQFSTHDGGPRQRV
jgi:hypothetical protein